MRLLTESLLQPDERYDELTRVIDDLNRLFLATSGLENDREDNRESIFLPDGKAIGPVWAGMCVRDLMRTKKFLRGVYLGIRSALEKFPIRPIRILYAGTGPFATLAIPLTTVFSEDEIHFTMIEINPESVKYLKKVVSAFGAEKFIDRIVLADAARYQVEPDRKYQVIISETMQNALQKEPQVAITLNLLPHLAEEGILIPENIEVEAVLLNPRKSEERMLTGGEDEVYLSLGTIFELNRDTARRYAGQAGFPLVELEIPAEIKPGYSKLCLLTQIQVFGSERLTPWQSSLTNPKHIMNMDPSDQPVGTVDFQYKTGQRPGFEHYTRKAVPEA